MTYTITTEYRHCAQKARIIIETWRFPRNQVANLSSSFTDSPWKCVNSPIGRSLIASISTTLFTSPALSDQALPHFIIKSPAIGGMAPAAEPSFLCTFCWTAQFQPARSRALGREARIACETCWRSVLDLSICWVCGEIVVRGEEVVSLGWCFWHRVCFGCLICGTSLDLPLEDKDDEGELRWIDDDDPDEVAEADSGHADRPDRGRTRRQRGVELESVPLCSWCENATEGLYMDELLEMGLKNVTRKDDGLSKSRLDMLKRTKSKDAAQLQQTPRTLIKGKRQGQSSEDEPEGRANPLAGAVDMGIGEDENGEGTSNCCSPVESIGSMASPIYVSVLDAIGEPSFRASKTKPLPRWMTFLPGNRQQTFEQNDTGRSSPETRTPVHGLNSIIEPQDSCHTLDTAATVPGLSSLEQLSQILDNGSDTTVCSKMEDAAAFEPVISKDSRFEISNCHTSSDYQWRHPQRNATPCPFKRAAYRLPLNLSIPRSLFPRPLAETTMPAMPTPANEGSISTLPSQVTPHLFFRDEGLRKRDVSRDTEPIVERFKRPKTECDTSAVGEKNESGKEIDYAVQSGYIDKRDVLRMELLRLFNECREPSQEQ